MVDTEFRDSNKIIPRVRIKNVSKIYNHKESSANVALENIQIDIYSGELVSIIGPSGSGKTTILHLIAGFTQCTGGNILIDGILIKGPGRDRTLVFQEYNLFPWKTVIQNIMFGLKAKGIHPQEQKVIAQKYIHLFQLDGTENLFPFQLSGGMRQRVAIARALVIKPACILMDEPFAALDAQLRGKMQHELLKILERELCTILFVTHDVDEAVYLSDRVIVLSESPGRIVRTVNITLGRPRNPEIKLSNEFQKLKHIVLFADG